MFPQIKLKRTDYKRIHRGKADKPPMSGDTSYVNVPAIGWTDAQIAIAERYAPKLTAVQFELLVAMLTHGARPIYELMPGSVVWLGGLDWKWRRDHGGKPVAIDTLNSMVTKGVLRRVDLPPVYGRKRWTWEVVE